MSEKGAELVRRTRARHPERARYQALRNNARAAAALVVARGHPNEFDREFRRQMRRRHLALALPALPAHQDWRRNGKHTVA